MFGLDGLISGGLNLIGGMMTNSAQDERQRDAQAFNQAESATNREWQGQMWNQTSAFNASEAEKSRSFASNEAQIARDFNASEAEKARLFTQQQSSTAYQRAVEDMKKAGINPMLAYMKGGADTGGSAQASGSGAAGTSASVGSPSGSMASSPAPQLVRNVLGEAVNSAREWALASPQADNIKQQTATGAAEERVKYDTAHNLMLQGRQIDQQTKNLAIDGQIKQEQLKQQKRSATVADIDQEHYSTKLGNITRRIGTAFKDLNPFVSSAKTLNQMYTGD